MNILITGSCGFVGSNIAEYYAKLGHKVIGVDNLTKHELIRTGYRVNETRDYNLKLLKSLGIKNHIIDIKNKSILKFKKIDYIVHCAAQPAMTIAIENPRLDLESNVIGSFNVLELARKLDVPVLLFSSIHVYGTGINDGLIKETTRYTRKPLDIDENHKILTGTLTPLHASKRAMEIYGQTYIDTYGLKVGIYRATGMYGPNQFGGEDHGWVANFCIRNIMEYPITIFGTGKQVRDILYISDVNTSIDAFYKHPISGIYNIGGGIDNMVSLVECIDLIEKTTGIPVSVKWESERFGDLRYFVCNISKAKDYLEWNPIIKPKEGIEYLVKWIMKNKRLFR